MPGTRKTPALSKKSQVLRVRVADSLTLQYMKRHHHDPHPPPPIYSLGTPLPHPSLSPPYSAAPYPPFFPFSIGLGWRAKLWYRPTGGWLLALSVMLLFVRHCSYLSATALIPPPLLLFTDFCSRWPACPRPFPHPPTLSPAHARLARLCLSSLAYSRGREREYVCVLADLHRGERVEEGSILWRRADERDVMDVSPRNRALACLPISYI